MAMKEEIQTQLQDEISAMKRLTQQHHADNTLKLDSMITDISAAVEEDVSLQQKVSKKVKKIVVSPSCQC